MKYELKVSVHFSLSVITLLLSVSVMLLRFCDLIEKKRCNSLQKDTLTNFRSSFSKYIFFLRHKIFKQKFLCHLYAALFSKCCFFQISILQFWPQHDSVNKSRVGFIQHTFFLVGHVYWEYSCLHIEKMLTFFADNPSSFSSICNYSYMFLFWFCFFWIYNFKTVTTLVAKYVEFR